MKVPALRISSISLLNKDKIELIRHFGLIQLRISSSSFGVLRHLNSFGLDCILSVQYFARPHLIQFTQRPPGHRTETQIEVQWTCLPFIRSGQNHVAKHSERGKKTRQTEEEVGRQRQGMDRPGVRQVPDGSGEQRNWRKLVVKSSVVPQRPLRLRD